MSKYVIDIAGNEAVAITTETRNLRALPFLITEDQLSTAKNGRKNGRTGLRPSKGNSGILKQSTL